VLGGILEWIFRYIFGAVFELDFSPLFGQNFARDLLVLRDFFDFEGCSGPVFGPLFARTFHHDFCHRGVRVSGRGLLKLRRVRVSSQGGMYLVGVVGSCRMLILWMSGRRLVNHLLRFLWLGPYLLTSGRCTQADDVMGEVVYAGRRMSSV
jgi:hypothetical protein